MTKISIVVIDPREHFPDRQPFFRIICQGCGHDDLLERHFKGRPLHGPILTDAYLRAERMTFDHLSGDGQGGARCPVEKLMSDGLWNDCDEDSEEEPFICDSEITLHAQIGAVCPACGHTNIVHPSPRFNPRLTCCALCKLQAMICKIQADLDV